MKFNKTVLASVIAFALAGCSDDDTSTGTDTTTPTNPTAASLSGKAADGYLENAEVCLDLNLNKACDSNEPTATTGTNGVFTLDTTQESIDSYPIIVNVIAGQTTDTDNPGVALTKGYVLSAPAKSVFVSPISTLIQNEIENGNSSEDAVAAVQLQLGTDQDVTKDYIAEKNNASLSDEDKAVFDQIHKVAQVTARVMATKLSELESSAAQQGISNKELQSVIAEKVSNVLSDINSQVVSEGDNFDPDTAADTIKDNIDLSPENIKDKVDVNNADKESQKSSLAELIRTEGMLWLSSSKSGLAPTLEYGVVSIDNQGEVIETEYKSNADYTAFDVYTPPSNTDLLLTESGWKLADDTIVGITSNPDGSDTLEMKTTELSLKTKVMKVDVSGLKVSDVMEKTADTQSVWAGLYSESTVFPEGTFAYRLKIESTIDDYFSLYPGAWCDEAYAAERGGMCNAINVEAATGSGSPAQTLDQIYKEASDGSLASTAILAGISNGGVVAEVIADGTVNYFLWDYMNPLGDPIATGSWKDTIVHGKVIREISAPVSITHMDGLLWNNFASNGKVYLSEVEGYVRILAPTSAVNEEEYVFSANSLQSILDSRDEFPTLGACLASLDDADYIPL
nr:hypothetical protein [Enterovibrio nigricans]